MESLRVLRRKKYNAQILKYAKISITIKSQLFKCAGKRLEIEL